MELCPHQSTCRFDLAARDITPPRTTQRAAPYHDNHIDVSYSCQSSASAIIQPTNYKPRRPGNNNYYYYINNDNNNNNNNNNNTRPIFGGGLAYW